MRVTRKARMKQRRRAGIMRKIKSAAIGSLAFYPLAGTEAATINTFLEIPAEMQSLINKRNLLRDYHNLQNDVALSRDYVEQAKTALITAQCDEQTTKGYLSEAQKNLLLAQANFRSVEKELARAQQESLERTQAALASQRAVAGFLPRVWEQETTVVEIAQAQQSAQANYNYVMATYNSRQNELAQQIENAWKSVNYQNNRLEDVRADIASLQAEQANNSTLSVSEQAQYEQEVQELADSLDEQQALLDELNDELANLQDQQSDAEAAEADARAVVQELLQDLAAAKNDEKLSQVDLQQVEADLKIATQNVATAQDDVVKTQNDFQKVQHEFEQFGCGYGYSTGWEYYNWHGAEGLHGHQWYQPIEVYSAEKKWDLGLETGYLYSNSGLANGKVSGLTDTNLSVTYKNDHQINSVHYGVNFSLPTGKSDIHQNALLADDLARFTSFGEGLKVTPNVSVSHNFTERDSVTGRLSYTSRSSYNFHGDLHNAEVQNFNDTYNTHIRQAEFNEKVKPGGYFSQSLEVAHIGESSQTKGVFSHDGSAKVQNIRYLRSLLPQNNSLEPNRGPQYKLGDVYDQNHNYDAENWWLKLFHRQVIDTKNVWQIYGAANFADDQNYDQHSYYFGTGISHEFSPRSTGYIMFNYGKVFGQSWSWRRAMLEDGNRRRSLLIGYDYRLNKNTLLNFKVERYSLSGKRENSYHGVNMSVMLSQSF